MTFFLLIIWFAPTKASTVVFYLLINPPKAHKPVKHRILLSNFIVIVVNSIIRVWVGIMRRWVLWDTRTHLFEISNTSLSSVVNLQSNIFLIRNLVPEPREHARHYSARHQR